ncbi:MULTISPECIES: MerR family transcriptional regulator [Catenuloplanes]|uniref:DNA-binding transcriptional MerR regulator n=1 Tax=Catenuloplanes niger TaxID=587534 RepID=A0AAE3ZTR7_9ACTN|nr:MerR family transcriptional regulator [Catenuloplanes niger]MDR7325924.1 DNA-binding transcriptional MerR regulator [Catenuloplanes niger]
MYNSGEVTAITGLSAHALRYYEREGLFPHAIGRSGGRWRTYTRQDVEWLLGCNRLRASGMPVSEIRRYAELVAAGPGNEAERLELMRAHQARMEDQMAELRISLDAIATKVAVYEAAVGAGTAGTLWTGDVPLVCPLAAPELVRVDAADRS